jgi:hypothetical protein
MTTFKLLSAALIAAAMLATPTMARTRHVTPRHLTDDANTSVSPTARYINDPFGIRAPRVGAVAPAPSDGGLATSAITRMYAEKAAQRNGSVWLFEAKRRQ